jgi:ABC-2 type transport system ATP-binding protein
VRRTPIGRAVLAAALSSTVALSMLGLTSLAPAGSAPAATAAAARAAGATVSDGCLQSVPEPGETAPVDICWTLFAPAGASRKRPVPLVVQSHGWGGSRWTDAAQAQRFTDRGYGVLSFDQRGFGESGGHAHVENPDLEGADVRALVAMAADLPWVQQDRKGDPRMGAIGGSYGGGYQFLMAFEEIRATGRQVVDALVPEITWHDLEESLAPEGVVRTEWALALSAGSLPSDALPWNVYKALVEGAATGTWPDGSVPGTEDMVTFMEKNGPKWQVGQGARIDVPVLFGQGTTDTLFPLEQALTNWQVALTKKARKRSIFTAYNGGHVLPAVLPAGVTVDSDPCAEKLSGGDFTDLTLAFLDRALKGGRRTLRGYGRLHLATPDSGCVSTRTVARRLDLPVGTVATTAAAGVPIAYEVAPGPVTVAGGSHLTALATTIGVDARAFYGLAIGTSPADAVLVQNNVLPFRAALPLVGEEVRIELPAVGVEVPEGQSLFLLASPISDTFVGMGSRTPGVVLLEDTVLHTAGRLR